ncbi:thioredoxin-like domain-containing protein [Parabacteroides sp. PF5-9]|uniref:thioredoxin-like domain-containing protein n=1 Tax=Parabacteroides sp. PF5-9 TaxID=1742404 RepID=UPI0024749371|nr:thioredoxin-like domain-containing protein [Parabacteroides sp. PF5-9]MDH6356581.1 hypothetical protein [Parabacteroides sp. PF5-9]
MRGKAYVLVIMVVLITMASGSKDANPTEGLNPGDIAPRIESLENQINLDFQNHSSRYTLLNFWAAYDAESRACNVRLANEVNKFNPEQIAMYSISLDENESVFHETVKIDRLNGAKQLHEGLGKMSVVYKKFDLEKGFRNFLINNEGMIVAVNVTPDKLTEVLNAN